MSLKILIAGVGNIFLGDDAFGVETARALFKRTLPEGVTVVDYGIRGFDLAYALLDVWDAVILVDALRRDGTPGTLYLIEPDLDSMRNPASTDMTMNPHGMDPVHVIQLAFSIGDIRAKMYLLGCEPKDFGDELEGRMGLSDVVQTAVGDAVSIIENLCERMLATVGACTA
jgi:hydrogenase maturation protease